MHGLEKFTSTNHYLFALLRQAQRQGIDTGRLLSESDIEAGLVAQKGARVQTEKIACLVNLMWSAMRDENLGLSRSPCKPGSFYMMGRLTIHQPNLEKALLLGFRFYDLLMDGYKLNLKVLGKRATLHLEQKDLDLDTDHLLTDLILLAWHRYASWLIGENLLLLDATFVYPPPAHADEYCYLFPTKH